MAWQIYDISMGTTNSLVYLVYYFLPSFHHLRPLHGLQQTVFHPMANASFWSSAHHLQVALAKFRESVKWKNGISWAKGFFATVWLQVFQVSSVDRTVRTIISVIIHQCIKMTSFLFRSLLLLAWCCHVSEQPGSFPTTRRSTQINPREESQEDRRFYFSQQA